MTVKTPAANLITSNDILYEEDPVAESETELVKKLNVLQQVVITGPGVTVLVVVPVDQQLHHRLHVVGRDECLLLPLAGDKGHPADGDNIWALSPHLPQTVLRGTAQLLDAVVLGLCLQLQ